MSTNRRTEEDWFLRGGERPKNNEQTSVVTCQNCGGDNLADEEQCTHCGAALQGGTSTAEYCGDDDDGDDDGDLREYEVGVFRTLKVHHYQTAKVRVEARSEIDAMDRVEEQYARGDLELSDLDWTDEEVTENCDEFTADGAEEI